jgi:transposase
MKEAASALEQLGMDGSEIQKFLEGLGASEEMQKLQDALEKLREAMEKAGMDPGNPSGDPSSQLTEEQMRQLMEQLRNYRMPELSKEQIEEMIRRAEELRKMIEAGKEIKFCKGCMGSGLGMGIGIGPGGIGIGMIPGLGGKGQGEGLAGQGGFRPGDTSGKGAGMGGPGQGRGGQARFGPDGKPIAPDQAPGMVNPEGQAQLIRTVRRVPDPDTEAKEYEALAREASRDAEEAIKRGEIPRQYRGYIRRYFDTSEDK